MTQPPPMTDRQALARHRARAQRMSNGPVDVLHVIARDEVDERRRMVNRTFTSASVISAVPEVWRGEDRGITPVEDAETLPLPPGSQDLIVSSLVLHWSNDPVGHLIQSRRALQPDGLFIGICLGGRTLGALRDVLAEAEIAELGGLSPRVAPMGDLRDYGALLQRAGLALPVADSFTQVLEYTDLFHLMRDLRGMGETNALAARHRTPPPRRLFARAADLYVAKHSLPGGRVAATFEFIVLTGWAPAASQPKPLRPGSAKSRLAHALGTEEQPLKGPGD